jgi:hypothetical protein
MRNAFSLDGPRGELTQADCELLDRLAGAIVSRGMAVPALLFLGSIRPLNSLGSQAMVFLRPFLTPLFKPSDYDRAAAILERREGIGALVEAIEAAEALQRGVPR